MTQDAAAPTGRPRRLDVGALADELRAWSEDDLVALLTARPDLVRPAPTDISTLAARALSPASLRRALDHLDRGRLDALEAVVVAADDVTGDAVGAMNGVRGPRVGSATLDDVATLLACDLDLAVDLLDDLRRRALVLRDGELVVAAPALLDVLGPVAGLAPPHPDDASPTLLAEARPDAAVTSPGDGEGEGDADAAGTGTDGRGAAVLDSLTDDSPAGAREILARLTWGPSTGTLDPDGPVGPAVRHLLARGLLRLEDDAAPGTVTLPRPVALVLRGGRLHRTSRLDPPPTTPRPVRAVDASAGAQAGEAIDLVDEIALAWGDDPPRVLRTGGLAVRDLAATTHLTGLDTHLTGLLLETAHAAGLLGRDGGLEPVWAPTRAYDTWVEEDDARRWARLVLAWRDLLRAPGRIGGRGETGPINAFSADLVVGPAILDLRLRVLGLLATLPPDTGLTVDDVAARLRWESPRLHPRFVEEVAGDTLDEAEILGVTVGGAIGAAGRALLDEAATPDLETAVDALTAAVVLPAPVDHVYLQADLTAIAPGRLDTHTAGFLRLVADVESRGGATTYRFSPASVRRALGAGWEVDDVLRELGARSRTPLPQPLEFLVRDAARGYGVARIGTAGAYLRSDDVGALDALLARPEAAPARLRRLAPTVLVSALGPTQLLALLRELDLHALFEGQDGEVVPSGAAPTRAPVPRHSLRPSTTPPDVRGVVAALHDGAARGPATASTGGVPRTDPAVTLSRLRQAVSDGEAVWLGVVQAEGEVVTRHVRPARLSGGVLHGLDAATGAAESWPVSRITGVHASEDEPGV
ncbi:helicase-associated domain-containing protein [Mobilicoccus pelagius]|uniref:Helicase XPB/Ssl2 N-terminal domain-containing protein n=1 Tax=Mobilicoccus pelagius NBRC 104925 TaxID=1089455 RepID=H5UTA8_9MICO|nr:helicase-associated domain-containing protein [Mobilicoccus pelagius]GAB48966.1 hypothetical protein MOPEL_091_00110 [Mobilicoccus pelagius NBRC 104925]